MKKKLLFIVLDGLAGKPVKSLGGKTELEAARTPCLDRLASNGQIGLVSVIPGVAPESDSAVLSILGYDYKKYYTGRGPLEAVGASLPFKDGMLALRCNFATTSDGFNIIDRRAGRDLTPEESAKLSLGLSRLSLTCDCISSFYASVEHRGVLLIKGKKAMSDKITNVDPAYEVVDGVSTALPHFDMKIRQSRALAKGAQESADALNSFTLRSYYLLKDHPVNKARKKQGRLQANIIICRDAGTRVPRLYDINKRYKRRFAILADMPLEVGIGKLAGMDVIRLPLPEFNKKDYAVRLRLLLKAMKRYDCLYIHIKGPDLFGHDGDARGKMRCIEDIDSYFIKPLLQKIDLKDTIVAVTADHATPSTMKAHSADPVPLLIAGAGISAPKVEKFSEKECARCTLRLKGTQLMPYLQRLLR